MSQRDKPCSHLETTRRIDDPFTTKCWIGFFGWLGLCAFGIQFDLVAIRIADINGITVVLLHRFFGKPVRNQSVARLVRFFRWDEQCKVLATAGPIMSK